MRPPSNINTNRPIQISVDGRDSYIQVDTGGYNLTNDGIECNDPDTSIFIPWKYIQWIEQSTAVDTVFNHQTTGTVTGANQSSNPVITNPSSIVDSHDDEIRLLERNNPFARIDMKLFRQCVNNHIIEHDENGWKIRISNQRIGHNENQAMSVIRSNPSLQVYLTQSLSEIPLSDMNQSTTSASMNTTNSNVHMNTTNSNSNTDMNKVTSDNNDNKAQSNNDPWVSLDDGMQTLLAVDPQADNEDILDDYDDDMSYTPGMLIESYNDDTHSNNTSTITSDNTTASDNNTVNTMNNKTVNNSNSNSSTSITSSMNNNKPTTTRLNEQSYTTAGSGFGFGFGLSTTPSTNNKNTTTSANNASMSSQSSHDTTIISEISSDDSDGISDVSDEQELPLNSIITANDDVYMTAAYMPSATSNASTVNTDANNRIRSSRMNGESSQNSNTTSMQTGSSIHHTTASQFNNSDYIDNNASNNTESSPIHPSRKKKNPVKHHLTDYEVDDSSNTDNATTADENGCDWVVLMVTLGYTGTIVSRWRSRSEAEADRDARIENNHVNSSMIPLNYMVFKANGNRLYDRKYIPRDKNGIPLKGYNEYGEYVAGLPGYEF